MISILLGLDDFCSRGSAGSRHIASQQARLVRLLSTTLPAQRVWAAAAGKMAKACTDGDYVETIGSWIKGSIAKVRDLRAAAVLDGARAGLHQLYSLPYADTVVVAAGTVLLLSLMRLGTRRFRTATEIPPSHMRSGKVLRGFIVAVNDSDNVRFYHPCILSQSWWRPPALDKTQFRTETINIRLAGVDAPEMGHFGGVCQPFAEEAKSWLAAQLLGRRVTIVVHRLDHYARAVATVQVRRWLLFRKNVSLEMVKAGLATVYTSAGAEYGGREAELIAAEDRAKRQRRGMWKQSSLDYVSPAEYKRQLRSAAALGR